jgi:RimJ/RimL family protein N-acetyltransferase
VARTNEFGQPIGAHLGDWEPPQPPPRERMEGGLITLEPLGVNHSEGLWQAFRDAPESLWTYLAIGPFASAAQFRTWIETVTDDRSWQPYVVVGDDVPQGFVTYLRIDAPGGVIEIGSIGFAPSLQRTTAATETLYLLMRRAFELGYRRLEWKCDALNAPSRRAAERLGFRYEGTFRQATHYKGRNRDTAWFAILDSEWPDLDRAFQDWLAPENFGEEGFQRTRLSIPRPG